MHRRVLVRLPRRLCSSGTKAIYITARSEKALAETKARVNKANPGTQCEYMVCDVTDEEQVKASIKDCVAKFGGIDVVDSNAGYLDQWKKIGESDTTSWWKTWEVNLKGTYYMIRYTIPYLIESVKKHSAGGSTGGHLILISSRWSSINKANGVRPIRRLNTRSIVSVNSSMLIMARTVSNVLPSIQGVFPPILAKNMPKELHAILIDEPDLAAGFAVWLCSGKADWAKGRYLSCNWDVDALTQL